MGRMETVVAAGSIVLLAVAGGSLVWVQEFAGLQDLRYDVHPAALPVQEGEIGPEGVVLEWPAWSGKGTPFSADVRLTVTFSGQAAAGGEAAVRAVLIAPDGQTRQTVTVPMPIAPAASSTEHPVDIMVSWAPVPGPERGNPAQVDRNVRWDHPLRLEVEVEAPADPAGVGILPVRYSFHAAASGSLAVYEQVVV